VKNISEKTGARAKPCGKKDQTHKTHINPNTDIALTKNRGVGIVLTKYRGSIPPFFSFLSLFFHSFLIVCFFFFFSWREKGEEEGEREMEGNEEGCGV
jgi:hypothetical protein